MTRLLLAAVVGCLVLLAVGRMNPSPSPAGPTATPGPVPAPAAVASRSAPARIPVVVPTPPASSAPADRTPVISRMARMEGRRRLSFSGHATYLDSLFVTPDSTVRRWADGAVIRVSVIPPEDQPGLVEVVRSALAVWADARIGVSFVVAPDTLAADIVVGWVDRFADSPGSEPAGPGRTGLTEVRSDGEGEIRHARVTLARADGAGIALTPDQVRAIAIHEFGHALGLPHSGRREDIMYPTVMVSHCSERDRASVVLLYSLAPGSLRDPPGSR